MTHGAGGGRGGGAQSHGRMDRAGACAGNIVLKSELAAAGRRALELLNDSSDDRRGDPNHHGSRDSLNRQGLELPALRLGSSRHP